MYKNWGPKNFFGDFSKIRFLAKNLTLKKINRKIPFLKMYTFIYLTLLVLSYDKNNFHKKLQFCKGGTILIIAVKYNQVTHQFVGNTFIFSSSEVKNTSFCKMQKSKNANTNTQSFNLIMCNHHSII